MFTQAADEWDLERLYTDLAVAKKQVAPHMQPGLTPVEKEHLRGLLCGCSPKEIAKELCKDLNGLEVALSNTLYRYVKQLTKRPLNTPLNWRNVVHWLEEAGYRNNSPPDTPPEPNFVGREGAIADLDTLVSAGAKVIGIYGKGGVGKTTLAQQYFKKQGFKVLTLSISLQTEDITPVEEWIGHWLRRDFKEEPESTFCLMLDQLKHKLQTQRIGVLIDNLEPALDANGKFIKAHRRYVDLLKVLAAPDVKSITLITSRDCLYEGSVNVQPYKLLDLDQQAWQQFFENKDIQFRIDSSALINLHCYCGGNAQAMKILSHAIKEDYSGDLDAYWQANQGDLWVGQELENLVESQFNRLHILGPEVHRLLCRLGCYRYQDVPRLPKQGLFCLLWDVPQAKHNKVIQCLRDRALVEFSEQEYWLHPVIRAEATRRLRKNPEWQVVNQNVAEFYSAMAGCVNNQFQVKAAFEAIEHFFEINNFEAAYKILMLKILEIDKIENLALSEKLWSNQSRVLRICEQAIENLSDEQKVLMLIPMGYIYSAHGIHSSFEIHRERHQNALDISQRILDITRQINPTHERSAFAEMSAYLIASKANRFIGKLEEALKASEQANKIAKRAGKPYGKALALYEIGLVYLEIGKPGRALRRIVAAAFQASTGNSIPRGVYQLSHTQISDLSSQIEHVFDSYNVNNEAHRKKKFAVLLNIARCLNLMKLYPLAKIILDIVTQRFVIDVRPGTRTENCFLRLELAIYYLAIGNEDEAIKSYESARKLSSHKDKGFRAFVLITFANWKYKLGQYMEALGMYREIEDMLEEEGSSLIEAQNHYQLSCTYLKCEPPDREKALGNLHKAEGICRELELPLLVEVMKLKEILEGQGE